MLVEEEPLFVGRRFRKELVCLNCGCVRSGYRPDDQVPRPGNHVVRYQGMEL